MKVLLVEDSRKHRQAGVADLTALGHEVIALGDYADAAQLLRKQKFDAALLDLLMPAEPMTLGNRGMEFLGQSIPVGFALSMLAAAEGVPLVAVATDTNHHDHPASAMVDWFIRRPLRMQNSLVLWMHAPLRSDGSKDWAEVLNRLLQT